MLKSITKNFEHQVIFYLLENDPNKITEILQSKNSCDWSYIIQKAEEHNIIPILYRAIKECCLSLVPADAVNKFQSQYKLIAKYNFARSTELIKLIKQLEKHYLPVIAYKGMALAEFAYRDTTMRQFGDIDLFIRKRDFPEVKKRLFEIGCSNAWELTTSQEKAVLKFYYEYPFLYGENNTLIEVHWEFVEPFFTFEFDIEKVWDRADVVNLYGTEISTLSAEDYLIILCSHGSKHFWKRLSWICDVATLIENKTIDWDIVIQRASKYGNLRMVLIGAYLSQKIFKTKWPNEIIQQFQADKKIIPLAESFIEKLFDDEREPSDWFEMAKLHLKMREKLSTRLKYSYRLFTTKAVDSLFLPMGRPR